MSVAYIPENIAAQRDSDQACQQTAPTEDAEPIDHSLETLHATGIGGKRTFETSSAL